MRRRKRAPEHHMTFHHLLESFEGARSCGLCALEERSMRRYFDSVLYESVTDPEIRADLRRAHGYCSSHAHYLVGLGAAFDTAVLYQDEIEDFLDLAQGLPDEPPATGPIGRLTKGSGEEIPEEWLEHPECPACRLQRETRAHYLEAFIDALADESMQRAYRSGSGLCLPHLRLFLAGCRSADSRRLVVEHERGELRGVLDELHELCRKFDYRFAKEKVGEERDSWRRAVLLINGSPLSFPGSPSR